MTLWNWAVKAYGGAGVAEACLSLQDDDGQNVPLLLWAVWLAGEGHALTDAMAAEAVRLARPWSNEVIVPLRILRRRLKTEVSAHDADLRLPLREKIKAIELEAEQALMTRLANLDRSKKDSSNQHINALALGNLTAVAGAWGERIPIKALSRLAEALSEDGFLQYKG